MTGDRLRQRIDWILLIGAGAVLVLPLWLSPTGLLARVGFPAHELTNPWLRAEVVTLQVVAVFAAVLVIASRFLLFRHPQAVARLAEAIDRVTDAARQFPVVIPLSLTCLILAKTVLQLGLYGLGYTNYSGDDFGRTISAAFWLRYHKFDLGMDGWLGLAGSGWLPLSDYLYGLGLAVHPDLFLTPKIINLVISAIVVIVVYLLGRELFGRLAGFLAAGLFALLPWHVWLGISGMTAELPSLTLMALFGVYLVRWLKTDSAIALLAAALSLAAAGGFRYELWLFAVVFSVFVAVNGISRWRDHRLTVQSVFALAGALVLVNAFPVFWMAANYVVYGDWLPALHQINAFMVAGQSAQSARTETQMGIVLMAIGAYPLEVALSVAGMMLAVLKGGSDIARRYLLLLGATLLLFAVVFKGELPAWLNIPRYLLVFIMLALPYAGLVIARLLSAPPRWRHEGVMAGLLLLSTTAAFDLGRSLNYPASFPKDAVEAGFMLRRLQQTGTVSPDAKVLIERAQDWGDLGVIVVANTPERFVVINELGYRRTALSGLVANKPAAAPDGADEGVRGSVCEAGFETRTCQDSIEREQFGLVILSSAGRIESFKKSFHAPPAWIVGRYHIFDIRSEAVGKPEARYKAIAGGIE